MNRLSMHKVFYHLDNIRAVTTGQFPFPLHFIVGLTTRCNHRCSWCSAYTHSTVDKTDIDLETLLESLLAAKHHGLKAVTYVGQGEPLLYRDFAMLVTEMAKIGLEQACFTNGALLHQHKRIILENFLWLRVSLDAADPEQHKDLHRAANDFENIIATLSAMIQERGNRKVPTIGVQYGLHQATLSKMPEAAKLTKKIGLDYFSIKPIYNRGAVGKTIEKNNLTSDLIKHQLDETLSIADETFDVYYKPYQFELMDNPDLFSRHYDKCYGPHFEWHVFENGDVMICGPLRLKLGNLYEKSIEDLWNSTYYRELLKNINIDTCYKGCRVHSLNELLWGLENPRKENHINFI
jgi:MoaA/NifB/PqqE/SkfB family radical SAM enzyme